MTKIKCNHEYKLTGYVSRTMWVAIYNCKFCMDQKDVVLDGYPIKTINPETNIKNSIF